MTLNPPALTRAMRPASSCKRIVSIALVFLISMLAACQRTADEDLYLCMGEVGYGPNRLLLSPTGQHAVITGNASPLLYVLSRDDWKVERVVTLQSDVTNAMFSRATGDLIMSTRNNADSGRVLAYDVSAGTTRFNVEIPIATPAGLALSADGLMIYVASKLHSTILVLDAKTGVPLRTVRVSEEVEDRAVDIVASPIGNILHVVTFGRGGTKLFAVDMGANELLKRKSFGIAVFTSALSISRTGKYIFLGSLGTAGSERTPGKTLIIDPRTYDVLGEVEVGHTPVSIISGVDESIFYVANNGELPGTVTIGSVDNKQTKQSINVPSIPTGLAFSGSEDVLFVLTALDQTRITEINRRDLTVNKSYIVGPFGVATASKTQMEQKCSHHKLTEILNTQSVRKAGRS